MSLVCRCEENGDIHPSVGVGSGCAAEHARIAPHTRTTRATRAARQLILWVFDALYMRATVARYPPLRLRPPPTKPVPTRWRFTVAQHLPAPTWPTRPPYPPADLPDGGLGLPVPHLVRDVHERARATDSKNVRYHRLTPRGTCWHRTRCVRTRCTARLPHDRFICHAGHIRTRAADGHYRCVLNAPLILTLAALQTSHM